MGNHVLEKDAVFLPSKTVCVWLGGVEFLLLDMQKEVVGIKGIGCLPSCKQEMMDILPILKTRMVYGLHAPLNRPIVLCAYISTSECCTMWVKFPAPLTCAQLSSLLPSLHGPRLTFSSPPSFPYCPAPWDRGKKWQQEEQGRAWGLWLQPEQ